MVWIFREISHKWNFSVKVEIAKSRGHPADFLGGIQQLRGPNFTRFWPLPPLSGQLWTFYLIHTIYIGTLCHGTTRGLSTDPLRPPLLVHVVIECSPTFLHILHLLQILSDNTGNPWFKKQKKDPKSWKIIINI